MCVPTVGLPASRRSRSTLRRMAISVPLFCRPHSARPYALAEVLMTKLGGGARLRVRYAHRNLRHGSVAYAQRCLSVVERFSGISAGPPEVLGWSAPLG